MEKSIIEELYAPPEIQEAFEKGRRYERSSHQCRVKEVVRTVPRKEHPRSQSRAWGVVSNRRLLNPTFTSEAEAARFIFEGLTPVNPKYRTLINDATFPVKL